MKSDGSIINRLVSDPTLEVTYIPISISSSEQYDPQDDVEYLGLRGGFLEDEDLEMVESESQDDEDMASQPQDSSTGVELGLRGGSGSGYLQRYDY